MDMEHRRVRCGQLVAAVVASIIWVSGVAQGALPEPSAIRYGSVLLDGSPLALGKKVEARVGGPTGDVVGTYTMAAAPAGTYVLRIALVTPTPVGEARPTGSVRLGVAVDTVSIFADGEPCTGGPYAFTERGDIAALNLICGDAPPQCNNDIIEGTEQCDDGLANGTAASCCTTSCTYKTAGTACNDGNECTTDTLGCNAVGVCQGTPVANGVACTSDSNVCTDDVCTAGQCTHAAKANGTDCADALFCNGAETCQAGACAGAAPCAVGDVCDEPTDTCKLGACASGVRGDCNGSNSITGADVTCTINRLFNPLSPANGCADCNGSNSLTGADVTCIIRCVFGECP